MKIHKKIIFILLILFLIYTIFGVFFFINQDKLIYFPNKTDFADCPAFINAEQVTAGSMRAYLTRRSPDKIIVYYHGNAGRACDRSYMDSFFAKQNYSTLFVEYSGYSENENNTNMQKILKNVDDTIDYIKTQKYKDVVVGGESLGVGPASYFASHTNVSKLILIAAYNNIASVAYSQLPIFPMSIMLRNNFTPDKWLQNYKGEVDVILGEFDEVIPNEFGKQLYEGLATDQKNLYMVKDSMHNSIYGKVEFQNILQDVLK